MKVRRSRKQRSSLQIRQKQTLYLAVAGAALAALLGVLFFFYLNTLSDDTHAAPGQHTSIQSGPWTDGNTWDSGTYPGTISGLSVSIPKEQSITIERYVTSNYSLDFAKDAVLTVTDTLVILGDLTLDKDASLVVGPNGVLVVRGNLVSAKALSIASGGVIAVGGDANFAKDLNYDDSGGGELFVVGNISESNTNELGSAQDGTALESQYPDISAVINSTNTTLPITLLDFTAQVQGRQVIIAWSTESETHNDYFEIERSTNGQQYEVVGKVPGAGNSSSVLTYTLTDEHPLPGISYYRLRQTDFDGQNEAFDWVAVSVDEVVIPPEALAIARVFPNPFSTSCSVAFTRRSTAVVTVQLIDLQGTVIASQQAASGDSQLILDNLYRLSPGPYLIRLVGNGVAPSTRRVFKR